MPRAATVEDVDELSELALASKGVWGYDRDFLEACREELTVHPHDLTRDVVRLLEDDEGIAGFYQLRRDDPEPEIACVELFYVRPDALRCGHGRALWSDLVIEARRAGIRALHIEADPHAEDFYVAMGAHRVGDVPSGSIPGRRLPLLRLGL